MARGIRRRRSSYQVYTQVGGRFVSRTFPLTTSREDLRAELHKLEQSQSRKAQADRPLAGSLAADCVRYCGLVRAMPTYRERQRHLLLWCEALGRYRSRHTVTSDEVAVVAQGWLAEGLAPQSVKHRLTALQHFYTRLDPTGPNPVKGVPKPRPPRAEARALPVATVSAILGAMPESKTRARLWLWAATGLTPATQARLTPDGVAQALSAGVLVVPGRRKGAGAGGRLLHLTASARAALAAWHRFDGYGLASDGSMYRSFQRACVKVGVTGVRPYDLRHTFATELAKVTGDLRTVARVLGHAKLDTVERYALAALAGIDKTALDQLPAIEPAKPDHAAESCPPPQATDGTDNTR